MASHKKRLGQYVTSRRVKYRHPLRILFHISLSPRKVLHPHITTFQDLHDADRARPQLFLCQFKDIHSWLDWVFRKHKASRQCTLQRQVLDRRRSVVLYVHLVRVDAGELTVPVHRYCDEFIVGKALRPVAVVPVRYYEHRPPDLSKVAARAQRAKQTWSRLKF